MWGVCSRSLVLSCSRYTDGRRRRPGQGHGRSDDLQRERRTDFLEVLSATNLPDFLKAVQITLNNRKDCPRRVTYYDEFQGARYEIAIAAAFVKCDFQIEWIEDKSAKHPEFIARNPRKREEVAVETKSRRRPGVLHDPGTLPPP